MSSLAYTRPAQERWLEIQHRDNTVARILEAGGSVYDCAVALFDEKERLFADLMKLDAIAPRRLRTPDGRVMVWHCPDDMIPETVIGEEMGPPPEPTAGGVE